MFKNIGEFNRILEKKEYGRIVFYKITFLKNKIMLNILHLNELTSRLEDLVAEKRFANHNIPADLVLTLDLPPKNRSRYNISDTW